MIGLSGLARGALPSPYLHRRISMTVMVAQFLGQRHGSQILCVPAGIQIPLQTFQDQLCPACIGKASTPVFFFGINFNFYAAAVSGIRGRTGHNDVILANRRSRPFHGTFDKASHRSWRAHILPAGKRQPSLTFPYQKPPVPF